MVEAHGGHIDVTCVVCKGTEFRVRLPIKSQTGQVYIVS
jgi:chemotaxis protein histidine kinase CheA